MRFSCTLIWSFERSVLQPVPSKPHSTCSSFLNATPIAITTMSSYLPLQSWHHQWSQCSLTNQPLLWSC